MAILQLVDQMTDLLNEGREVPLSRYRMVDSEEFSQMLERMRISVPSSIRESERTLVERDNILARARAEADQIIQEARDIAGEMLGENSLVVMARQEAHRIVEDGQEIARQRTSEADSYATQVLQELHEKLASISGQVENGIAMMTQQSEPYDEYNTASSGNLEMHSMSRSAEPTIARRANNPLMDRTSSRGYGQEETDNREYDAASYETPAYKTSQFENSESDNREFDNRGFTDGDFGIGGMNHGGFDNSRFDSNEFTSFVDDHQFDDNAQNYTAQDYASQDYASQDYTARDHVGGDKPLQPPMLNYLSDPTDPMSDHL